MMELEEAVRIIEDFTEGYYALDISRGFAKGHICIRARAKAKDERVVEIMSPDLSLENAIIKLGASITNKRWHNDTE